MFLVTKLPKYYIIVYLLFLLSKARQTKTEHKEMKISQPIFGILVVLTKNELTKICNEPGINLKLILISELDVLSTILAAVVPTTSKHLTTNQDLENIWLIKDKLSVWGIDNCIHYTGSSESNWYILGGILSSCNFDFINLSLSPQSFYFVYCYQYGREKTHWIFQI